MKPAEPFPSDSRQPSVLSEASVLNNLFSRDTNMLPRHLPRFHFNSTFSLSPFFFFFFWSGASHPKGRCVRSYTHRAQVLNVALLPRSCAKCCFGCIPAIDRSLAAGAETAAGRHCASFNEFIQLRAAQTACGYTAPLPVNKASRQLCIRALTDKPTAVCSSAAAAAIPDLFLPSLPLTAMTSAFPLETSSPTPASNGSVAELFLVATVRWPPYPS